jgi:phosphoribosylformylglycinamidine synthase
VQRPGGDSAVVRVKEGPKGLALTTDVTPRYCEADPFEGGKQAVAEAWRNLSAVGAKPMALTDNLNFGNPERPEIMGQFVGCVQGIAAACKALEFPVVSGNVSLYNETNGRAILPTPTIGGVGLLNDFRRVREYRLQGRGRADRAARRNQGLDRPVALPARDLRAGGGRAAAGRPDGGAARGRLCARPDRGECGHGGA